MTVAEGCARDGKSGRERNGSQTGQRFLANAGSSGGGEKDPENERNVVSSLAITLQGRVQ